MLVHRVSLERLAAGLRRGELDLLDFVDQICERIERVDHEVQAFLPEPGRRARLLGDATGLLQRWPDPPTRPPLFGVPVGIKDIFHVDGYPTRAGTGLPPALFAGREALAVRRLKEAGVLIAGKTVTTEFAHSEPGPTRNPHNLAHTPGGSSSGSAAAVACGTCFAALGTQTIGSVIRPAAFCGVVGFKPSHDHIATTGLVYFSRSADHVGLFAQDVTAARLVAKVVCETWHDERAVAPAARPVIGVPVGDYLEQAGSEAQAQLELQLAALARAGYELRRHDAFGDIAAINHRHRRLTMAEAAAEHAEWFGAYEASYRPRTAATLREGLTVGSEELARARAGQFELRQALHTLMRHEQIDIWACPPAVGPAPLGLESTGDPVMNLPWTHAGLPAITVPAGTGPGGLPWGLQLAGAYGHDEQLLAWAHGIAQVMQEARGAPPARGNA